MVLLSQSPLGEAEAVPSFGLLKSSAALLIDTDPDVQQRRLSGRDGTKWSRAELEAFNNWAHWHREHAADPRSRRFVIEEGSWTEMRWPDEDALATRAQTWNVTVLDTTELSAEQSGQQVADWIRGAKARAPQS